MFPPENVVNLREVYSKTMLLILKNKNELQITGEFHMHAMNIWSQLQHMDAHAAVSLRGKQDKMP